MGRASNNGNIIGSTTTQTLPLPTNSTVRIETTSNLPLIQDQIHHLPSSNILKPSNQIPFSNNNYPHPTENLMNNNTTNVILDYLLFGSINARIDQAKNELKDDHQFTFHTKKGQGVDAIVEGLLQSHRTQASSMLLPLPLKHRLYLCQLLHLVFDRSHIAASGSLNNSNSITSKSNHSTKSSVNNNTTINNTSNISTTSSTSPSSSPLRNNSTQKSHKLPPSLVKYEKHFKNPLLSRCRKHRQSICTACNQHPSNSSITPPMTRRRSTPPKPIPTRRNAPGLIDAIPVFLNTCAITCRLDNNNESTVKPIWYDLLLDLLTQAAIECYLCDSYSSLDALLEIFSYGNIDPSDYHSDDDSESDDDDPHLAATRADDYLLWQRTTYLDEFRQKKKERMEEFLNVKGKLEQHFENLANKYPIRKFETDMLNYCVDITESLEPPVLMMKSNELSNDLYHIPGRYDGGIDIPMSDDEDFEDTNKYPPQSESNNITDGKKRRLSETDKSNEITKKNKNEEVSSFRVQS